MRWLIGALAIVLAAGAAGAGGGPRVRLETSLGAIVIELDAERAPRSTASFLGYVRDGFYDGTVFHRVIPGFMIQGGGLTAALERKPTGPPVPNEADNGLRNRRGTVALARTPDPHSATAQFFINLVDNPFLDFRARTPQGWGYAVFGQVVEGMEVVDRIARVPTTARRGLRDVPREPVISERAVVVATAGG